MTTHAPSRQLRNMLLKMLLGQTRGPDRLYVGLLTQDPGADVSLEFLESIELQAPSYARLPLRPGEWDINESGVEAVAQVTFRNAGIEAWRGIAAMFLATSAAARGEVVAVVPMRFGTHDLPPGSSITIPITVDM